MRITIHRGINQIGGCITEISTSTSKVLIDLGLNLPHGDGQSDDPLDSPQAVREFCNGCDAIFYTHYHGDHVDLFRYVPESVPQYIGPLAKQVMRIRLEHLTQIPGQKESRKKDVVSLERFETYNVRQRIRVGKDIWVTPFLVSHSAADAYMLLIEADGHSILHTGDFRGHGYMSKGLIPMLKKYIVTRGVDVLICEGTMLNRENNILHENELKIALTDVMRLYKNVFVLCSSTDIDRLASIHSANKQMRKRPLVCDPYQKDILSLFSETSGKKSPLYVFNHNVRVYGEKIRDWMSNAGFTMLVRNTDKYRRWVKSFLPQLNPDETVLVYSMFRGYILPQHTAFSASLKDFVCMFPHYEYLHTSGHATTDTLSEVCRLINPNTAIIPIHREKNSDFAKLDIGDDLRSRICTTTQTMDGIDIVVK